MALWCSNQIIPTIALLEKVLWYLRCKGISLQTLSRKMESLKPVPMSVWHLNILLKSSDKYKKFYTLLVSNCLYSNGFLLYISLL